MAVIAAAVIGGVATVGAAYIGSEASKNSANAAANARVQEAEIMGFTSRHNTIENAMTLKYGMQQQAMVFQQQLVFANLADRRAAALDKLALQNEIKGLTLEYNKEIYKETLGHVENIAKIKLEAKQMGIEKEQFAKSFELDKMKLLEDNMINTNDFLDNAVA